MNFEEKLKELNEIESKLPNKYHELLNKIDMYIYGCEQGLSKALELCIIASHEYALAENAYKKKFATSFMSNKDNMAATILKDYTKSQCADEACEMTLKEAQKQVADYHRIKWEEKLQVYKKIKGTQV